LFAPAFGRDDGSHAFVEVSAREMRKDQKPVGFQISARDVTEQKQLREMLVKAERLAAIGQVGIAVRHEINNPLTTVIGNIELILDRHGEMPEDLKTRLQAVLENALRIAEIVKRLHEIKHEKTVEYVDGVKMTDLKKR
jgi:C4-dicarboxylate-specific signal transduction histidine kinase